jgi:glycerophosphoryl diester phosphodiesterase
MWSSICTRRAAVCQLAAVAYAAPQKPGRVAVIAHRGAHEKHPENTIAAIEAAIGIGCDYVEIDVRTTSDGAFILMHNDSVDATTNGVGPVSAKTLAEMRQLRSRGEPIPTLDEALEAMRGRSNVYLDAKRIPARAIVEALVRHRMVDHAVVYGSFALLKELAGLGYPHLAMPEAVSVEHLRRALAELRPKTGRFTVAFDRRDFRDDVLAVAREAGASIFVDRLGPEDQPAAWEDAVRRGATGIQTDHPEQLIAALKGLRP